MTFRKEKPSGGTGSLGLYRIKPGERPFSNKLGTGDGPSADSLKEVITNIPPGISVPGLDVPKQDSNQKEPGRTRRDTIPVIRPLAIEETEKRGDEDTAKQAFVPVRIEAEGQRRRRNDDTLVLGRRKMDIKRMQALVPEGADSDATRRWRKIFSDAAIDPEHNRPNLDFDVFREHIQRTGVLKAIGRTFPLLMTESHLFIVSKESLEWLQNDHPELTGNADLTRSTHVFVRNGGGEVSDKWVSIFLINITDADIDAMLFAGTGRGRMAGALAKQRVETVETDDSLAPPEKMGVVDVDVFKQKLARCTRDPQCFSYFDAPEFSKDITQVLSYKGSYRITTSIGGIDYAFHLHVFPHKPKNIDEYPEGETFFYGKEFCVLVKVQS